MPKPEHTPSVRWQRPRRWNQLSSTQPPVQSSVVNALVGDLCAAVCDLSAPPSWRERLNSTARLLGLAAILAMGAWIYWRLPLGFSAVAILLMAGVAYALLLIATHEMVHGTLLGRPQLERVLGCLLGWPMAWPFLTYCRLHHLHHRWNGRDPRDPERTEALGSEGRPAGRWRSIRGRRLVLLRCLAMGGVGLIGETAWQGFRLRGSDRSLPAAQAADAVGVVVIHSAMLVLAIRQGELGRYLLFWLLLERVIGAIVQARGLIEHNGLWHAHGSHLLTQLYATRNVSAPGWLNALMGGLPHHSAHHAFPWIPAARLPRATARINRVLAAHHQPELPRVESYWDGLRTLQR